jgi:hypothetical protein
MRPVFFEVLIVDNPCPLFLGDFLSPIGRKAPPSDAHNKVIRKGLKGINASANMGFFITRN